MIGIFFHSCVEGEKWTRPSWADDDYRKQEEKIQEYEQMNKELAKNKRVGGGEEEKILKKDTYR